MHGLAEIKAANNTSDLYRVQRDKLAKALKLIRSTACSNDVDGNKLGRIMNIVDDAIGAEPNVV